MCDGCPSNAAGSGDDLRVFAQRGDICDVLGSAGSPLVLDVRASVDDSSNSLKSSGRSIELRPEEVDRRDPFLRGARKPVRQIGLNVRRVVQISFHYDLLHTSIVAE